MCKIPYLPHENSPFLFSIASLHEEPRFNFELRSNVHLRTQPHCSQTLLLGPWQYVTTYRSLPKSLRHYPSLLLINGHTHISKPQEYLHTESLIAVV